LNLITKSGASSIYQPGDKLAVWLHPNVESRPSPIAGMGVFALKAIPLKEVVCRWGGVVYTRADILAGRANPETIAILADGLYLADPVDAPDAEDYSINHSCEPNLWMEDAITLTTRRKILPGEELTVDYVLWLYDTNWVLDPCKCGSPLCRGRIAGQDWQRHDLQARYEGHFTPFLNRMISELRRLSANEKK
jgi:hypothetical protein